MTEDSIGPYRIVRLIKRGGQGKVYLGYDRRLQRKVAIKIDTLPRGRAARRRVFSEARKAARINSPHVVQIYDLIESGQYLAMVMEYVPGVDLETVLQQRRLSLASLLTVAAELTVALAASRSRRIVHGDLKAGNVLITRNGRVKLTDFGVARHSDDTSPAAAGSVSALTPEHLSGAPLDIRSDLFALGALLYRMLTQQHAFPAALRQGSLGFAATETIQLDVDLPDDDEVPQQLLTLVESLLRRDPLARPQNTHPVRSQLRSMLRRMPLDRAHSLQREAGPYFRPESADDVPLGIPRQLQSRGRSRLEYSPAARVLRLFGSLRLSTRIMLVSATLLSTLALLAFWQQERPVRVHFEPPQIHLANSEGIPGEVNREWLMSRIYDAVEGELGPLQVSGSVRPRAYYASVAPREPEYVISAGLRCSDALCVFSITRRSAGDFDYRQALIATGLPHSVWESVVSQSSHALFP